MYPSSIHDLPAPHIGAPNHRREAAPKPKGMKPLLTCEPLPDDREKKPAAQPAKKRKRVIPATPALSFDPKRNHVPSGRQEPPVPSPIFPRPSASESPTISYDEQRTTYFADREIQDPFYNGYDAQKRSRICSEYSSTEYSTSAYSDTPSTDVNDTSSALPDFYDSPASHTSSSSPAPSDPSPCTAECTVHVIDGQPMYSYSPVYVQQPVLYQDPYSYPMGPCPDRHAQGNPVQYSDPAYSRPVPHGIPAYPENTSYAYRRY